MHEKTIGIIVVNEKQKIFPIVYRNRCKLVTRTLRIFCYRWQGFHCDTVVQRMKDGKQIAY